MLTQAAAGGKPTSKNRSFNWESTVDGGKTFVRQDSTPNAETILTGFTPGTQVGVRVSVTLSKQPMGDWSQVVYIQAQ